MSNVATSRDLQAYVGQTGRLALDGLTVQIKVTDARVRFGHVDLLLTPVAGDGTRWVQSDRVTLDPLLVGTSVVVVTDDEDDEVEPVRVNAFGQVLRDDAPWLPGDRYLD